MCQGINNCNAQHNTALHTTLLNNEVFPSLQCFTYLPVMASRLSSTQEMTSCGSAAKVNAKNNNGLTRSVKGANATPPSPLPVQASQHKVTSIWHHENPRYHCTLIDVVDTLQGYGVVVAALFCCSNEHGENVYSIQVWRGHGTGILCHVYFVKTLCLLA